MEEVKADTKANELLDQFFLEVDEMRRNDDHDSLRLPIVARMFQQCCKLSLISAASRCAGKQILVSREDVEFAISVVRYTLSKFETNLKEHIHDSPTDAYMAKIITKLRGKPGMTLAAMVMRIPKMIAIPLNESM